MRTIAITFLLLLMAGFLFPSCQKQTLIDHKASITNQPLGKQYAYVHDNLMATMKALAPLMKNKEFMEQVRSQAANKFDGSTNVLLKTLVEDPRFAPLANTSGVFQALKAFANIDGENLYPQIYIPNAEKHQATRKRISASLRTASESEMQMEFVVYDGNETVTEVPSYTYNEEGEVIPTGTIVDEQYALNNEVYVISINETVEADGTLPEYIEAVEDVSGTMDIQSTVNFKIETIHVKDSKESWLAGDSEVHMKAIGSTWNHRQNGDPNSYVISIPVLRYASSSDYKGYEIKKVSRSDINSGVGAQYTINYPLHTNWKVDNFYSDPIAYTYCIFEYDAWPAGKKSCASLIPSNPDQGTNKNFINFRSSNSAYGGEMGGYDSNTNYAIYGNVSALTADLKYLYYDGYRHTSSSLDFTTRKY